jgi:tRNA threonylcarbamoyladenosine biosynthesis protein TsaE
VAETLEWTAADLEELQKVAERIASRIQMGDWVWMEGDLGAGKTALARALMRAWGYQGEVTSPTYLIMNEYELWGRKVFHIDGFRLDGRPADVWDPEALEQGICLVEWPQNTGLKLSRFQWKIEISVDSQTNQRLIRLISKPFC